MFHNSLMLLFFFIVCFSVFLCFYFECSVPSGTLISSFARLNLLLILSSISHVFFIFHLGLSLSFMFYLAYSCFSLPSWTYVVITVEIFKAILSSAIFVFLLIFFSSPLLYESYFPVSLHAWDILIGCQILCIPIIVC